MPLSKLASEIRSWSTAEHAVLGVFSVLAGLCGLLVGIGLFGLSTLALLVGGPIGVVFGAGTFAFMVIARLLSAD